MKDLLFLAADLWMIWVGFALGWAFIRRYGNPLLGIEWVVVATSGSNFLFWALLGGDEGSPLYDLAYFFDAFSRSFGITLILVIGLMRVTHGYKPKPATDVALFGLAILGGLLLHGYHGDDLEGTAAAVAAFYVVTNLATSVFLAYFAKRLWDAGLSQHAVLTGLVTVAACVIAVTYDFFPWSFDDEDRTLFYTAALATWGTQGFVYFRAYRALHDRVTEESRPLRWTETNATAPEVTPA